MRRIAHLFALLAASPALLLGAAPRPARRAPPQAWLFGEWIGGLYPPPSTISAQECLAQPMVIFTRDIVMRAVITDQLYTQRLVETARVTAARRGVPLRPVAAGEPARPIRADTRQRPARSASAAKNPDVLHVQRRGENEISFPGCAEFPYPLVRCPGR